MTWFLAVVALFAYVGAFLFTTGSGLVAPVVAALLFLCGTIALIGISALNKLDAIRDRLPKPPSYNPEKPVAS